MASSFKVGYGLDEGVRMGPVITQQSRIRIEDLIGKTAADFPDLTWPNFIANLVPVTIGNAIGGSLMVGLIYWFIYLRPAAQFRGLPAASPKK